MANDLQLLGEYRFDGRNEAEIRGDWIEPLLRLLGYGLGTRHDVLRERVLSLRPPARMIGSHRLEIDFVPTVFGERLWIMEAKRPQDEEDLFSEEHLGQAWSYATDPRISVPLMVLCDGTRLGVFDLTQEKWETAVFDRPKAELPECFDDLLELLGARRVAERIRQRQLGHLRTALMAQVDIDALDRTLADVETMVKDARPVVIERREGIQREARERIESQGTPAIDAAGIWGLAGHLNGPLWTTRSDIDHGVELIRRLPTHLRVREFENFEKACIQKDQEQPRMWFWLAVARMGCAILLSDDEGCGQVCREAAIQAANNHANGFADNPIQAASYQLQRHLGPLGWRLAANVKPTLDASAAKLAQSLEVEEWLRLDAEIGLTGTARYKWVALFSPRAVLAQVDPWDKPTIEETTEGVKRLLDALPKPAGFEKLMPIGDPWQESWLRGDPLRDGSLATLRDLAERHQDSGPGVLAACLYEKHR